MKLLGLNCRAELLGSARILAVVFNRTEELADPPYIQPGDAPHASSEIMTPSGRIPKVQSRSLSSEGFELTEPGQYLFFYVPKDEC